MSKKKVIPETPTTPEPIEPTESSEPTPDAEVIEAVEPVESIEPEPTPDAVEPTEPEPDYETDGETEQVISANNSIENFAVTENPNDSLNPLIVPVESVIASEPEDSESHDYVFPHFEFATEHEQRLMGIDEIRAYAGKLLDLVQRGF